MLLSPCSHHLYIFILQIPHTLCQIRHVYLTLRGGYLTLGITANSHSPKSHFFDLRGG